MAYIDIFSLPPWEPVALSIIQTIVVFCIILIGLQLVGRRVFAQRGPQDLILIVLVAEACDIGLTHEGAGFWGTVASVLALFVMGYLTQKVPFLRSLFSEKPIVLYKNGKLEREAMKKHMIDEDNLNEAARENGKSSYRDFDAMMLEGDGEISAICVKETENS